MLKPSNLSIGYYLLFAAIILLTAFSLRTIGLSQISIDVDEHFTNRTIEETRFGAGFAEGMRRRLYHMPVYFASLLLYPHNHSDFSLRYPSVLGSILTITLTMRILSHIYHAPRYALLAGIVLAIHGYFLLLSQQARMYPLTNALIAGISYLYLYYLNHPTSRMHWFIAQIMTMIAYLTHVATLIIVIGQGLSWLRLYVQKQASFARILYWATLQLVLIIPAVIWAYLIFDRTTETLYWVPELSIDRIFFVIQTLLLGQFTGAGDIVYWHWLLLAFIPSIAFFGYIQRIKHADYWLGLTLVPIIGIIALTHFKNMYFERYFAVALFAYIIILVLGFKVLGDVLHAKFPAWGYKIILIPITLLIIVVGTAGFLDTQQRKIPIFEHVAAKYIIENGQAGDAIASTRSILQVEHYVGRGRYKIFFQSDPEFKQFMDSGKTTYQRVWIVDNAYIKPVDWLEKLDLTPVVEQDGHTLYLYIVGE